MKECLVLFSGGKDSFLSAVLLLEQGYKVKLVHYDNMCSLASSNVTNGYKRLLKKYGADRVEYIGVRNISVFFRTFINKVYNMPLSTIKEKYGDITISQLNCLCCRLSMYYASILLCKGSNISFVADGARTSQLFAIEQDEMLELFKALFWEYNITLLLPVKDIKDDFDLKNELLIRGIVPKVSESQCLLGLPLDDKNVDKTSLNTSINIYNKLLKEIGKEMLKKFDNIVLGGDFI